MKRLLFLIIGAAVLWGGYWFVGATQIRKAYVTYFAAQEDRGWSASYSDLSVAGFPNRFDVTMQDVFIADTDGGLGWEAPFFQTLALSYKPNHIIAAFPQEHFLFTPQIEYQVRNNKLQASLVTRLRQNGALVRTNIHGTGVEITQNKDPYIAFDEVFLALHEDETRAQSYRLNLRALGIAAPTLAAAAEGTNFIEGDALLTTDRVIDQSTLDTARPQLTAIELTKIRGTLGVSEFFLAGKIDVDPSGIPTGELQLRLVNWRDVMKTLLTDLLGSSLSDANIDQIINGAAMFFADGDKLDLPIRLSGGNIFLGPLNIGPAPNLQIP